MTRNRKKRWRVLSQILGGGVLWVLFVICCFWRHKIYSIAHKNELEAQPMWLNVAVAEWVQENELNRYMHCIILIRKGWNKLGITHNCPPFNNVKEVYFYLKHSCSIYMKTMYSIFISNFWRRWFWKARVTIATTLLHFSTVFRTKLKNSLIDQVIFIEKLLHSRYQRDPGGQR